mmetsp:Transcript_7480/g.15089  ORF Transcript_7480/g.15089 Transcript_7480/m.15089 type:complete len:107 (-) Transcript_7480:51-371(-)
MFFKTTRARQRRSSDTFRIGTCRRLQLWRIFFMLGHGGHVRMKEFNEDLSRWNTGKVENTDRMFCKASSFKSDLTGWETSKCQGNMKYMFKDASSMPQKFKPKGAD